MRRDAVSRDQKPGKFKLVGSAAPTPARRAGDKVARPSAAASATLAAASNAPSASARWGMALLFLATSAAGGAGAVLFGLVDGLAK